MAWWKIQLFAQHHEKITRGLNVVVQTSTGVCLWLLKTPILMWTQNLSSFNGIWILNVVCRWENFKTLIFDFLACLSPFILILFSDNIKERKEINSLILYHSNVIDKRLEDFPFRDEAIKFYPPFLILMEKLSIIILLFQRAYIKAAKRLTSLLLCPLITYWF